MFDQLRKTNCPQNIFKLILSYVEDRRCVLKYGEAESSISMTTGCIQGSVCGPTFWNLVLDELLNQQLPDGCHIQAFADDVFLLVEGTTAEDASRRSSEALGKILDWGEGVKLKFSPPKTQLITFTPFKTKAKMKVTMGTEDLLPSSSIKLLGVVLDDQLNFIKHARSVVLKAQKVFRSLCKFVRPTWGVHPQNVETIYKHVIEPMVTYAAGIWGPAVERDSVKHVLRSFQRTFAIRAIRGFHTVSAVSAIALAQFTPLHLKVKEVWAIENVKATGDHPELPGDVVLERRAKPGSLLHPSERVAIQFLTAKSQEDADRLASPTNIYTDGCKFEDGDTGAAYVVLHPNGRKEVRKHRLDHACSVFQAELLALDEAVLWVLKHKPGDVTIYSDSESSLKALQQRSNSHPLVRTIHQKISSVLKSSPSSLRFVWVKAHIGVLGNEAADEAAKQAAKIHKAKEYTNFPLSHAKRAIRQELRQEWEDEYTSSVRGPTTRGWFPTLKDIARYKSSSDGLSFETTQFLSGHGFHREYLHRFKLSPTNICPCGGDENQSVLHLMSSCPRYLVDRQEHLGLCSEMGASPFNMIDVLKHPHLVSSFNNLITVIVRSLKAFNTLV